jgi:hypothetical protein
MKKIKLDVIQIQYSQTQTGAYALVLEDRKGKRRIPIIIGGLEAQAIAVELEKMKEIVRRAYQKVYGTRGVSFEHGKAGSCLWGIQTHKNMKDLCHHCHIHFLPREIDIRDRIKQYLSEEIIVKNINELKIVRKEILEAQPYLYFEDSENIGYVYPVEDQSIPRQFLRTCVAEELGIPHLADWITYPGVEHFSHGKEKLQPVLEECFKSITSIVV